MAIIDTSTAEVGLIEESTWGTTPSSPSLLAVRVKSASIKQNMTYVESEEIGGGGQTQNIIKTKGAASGQLAGELSYPTAGTALHKLLEGLLRSTWSTAISYSGTDVSFTASGSAIAASSGSPFTNAVVGQWIYISGATNSGNNGWAFITTKTDAQNINVSKTLTNESAGATVAIKGQYLRNGTTKKSYTIEETLDSSNYLLTTGCRVGSGSLTFSNGAINQWTMDVIGKAQSIAGSTADAGAGYTSAGSNQVTDPHNDWEAIYEGSTASAFTSNRITNLTININGNNREQSALGTTDLIGVGIGKCQVSGTINTYFETSALMTKFLNDTASLLAFSIVDASSNRMMVTLQSMKYTDGNVAVQGQNSDVMADLTFTGVKSGTYSVILQFDLAPA